MILSDTHTLIWLTEGNGKLGEQSENIIHHAFTEKRFFVSAISFRETAMLCQKQRVYLRISVSEWRNKLLSRGLQEIPLTGEIAVQAAQLQNFHADPADRFIVATALLYAATLITADKLILNWNGQLQRHNAKL